MNPSSLTHDSSGVRIGVTLICVSLCMALPLQKVVAGKVSATSGRPTVGAPASFSLPAAGRVSKWEAENATRKGDWRKTSNARSSGGCFLTPSTADSASTLSFTFQSSEPANIQVWPVFGPHSDRRPARRFPFPLERRPGPDVIDWWQKGTMKVLYVTSPELGRVSAYDERTEKMIASERVGEWIADLVVDREQDRIWVADAIGNRVLALRCSDLSKVQEIPVPAMPWSLSLSGRTLYVGCRKGKHVVAVDTRNGTQVATVAVPFEVASVEATSGESPRVIARPLPLVFDLEAQKQIDTDTERYPFRRRTSAETGAPKKPGWKRYEIGGAHTLKVSAFTDKGLVTSTVDTHSVTDDPSRKVQSPNVPILRDSPGPEYMVAAQGRLYFTSPTTGRVGVVDMATDKLLPSIDVGGYVSDIVFHLPTNLIAAADATNNQVVLIKVSVESAGTIHARVPVPAGPVTIETFLPPAWLKGVKPQLYVGCWAAKQVVALDPALLQTTWQANLPGEPLMLGFLMPPNSGWWPLIPTDRLPLEMRTRLGVLQPSRSLDPITLQDAGPLDPATPFKRHTEVSFDVTGGKKVFSVDNQHTIRVALQDPTNNVLEQRWLDTTPVTDSQQEEDGSALRETDDPGAVSIALDGGKPFPWRRELWMSPEQEQLQQSETAEFWEWNATHFSLPPGKHVLTIKTTSEFTQIDALRVKRTLKGWADLKVIGAPPNAEAVSERYRSLFYDKEPVRFDVSISNNLQKPQTITMQYQVTNYLAEKVATGQSSITVDAQDRRSEQIHLPLKQTGTFTLSVAIRSPQGERRVECRFLRIPKLDHPRMLFRKEDMGTIRTNIERNPALYENYFAWLRRQCDREGFLPAGLTVGTFSPKLPAAQKLLPNGGGWRRYDLGWRLLAVQFGAMFDQSSPRRDYFRGRIADIIKEARADNYVTFHHHGPFFPGTEAALFDLVAATPGQADESVKKMRDFFHGYLGDMNVLPWTLACIEEPLTPRERQVLWHIGEWFFNVDRYFDSHMGRRGGQRWLNDRTGCYCPYAGYGYSFIYLRNFLNEPQFQERNIVRGFLTHTELIHPMRDNSQMLGPVGPRGEPLKWLDSVLCQHPLLKSKYAWEGLLQKLQQPTLASAEADKLLQNLDSASTSTPMAFVVPIGLALGWYDPKAPEVQFKDTPSTILFDKEGEAVLRSHWKPEATEVYFTAGIRDHVYRHQPTHLQIAKAGEFLLGTASSWGDDGNSDPGKTWGNVVVIEPSDWLRQWGENKRHPRAEEYCVFNRFSDETYRYITRNQRMVGYSPAEGGFGGGLDLHGHTESVYVQEGDMLAYETWPDFDYVAGDATNAWPVGLANEVYRQVVFVKPDVVVVYDRLALGPKADRAYWIAATGSQLDIKDRKFTVRSGDASMSGEVLMPSHSRLQSFDPAQPNKYSNTPPFSATNPWFLFDGATKKQKVLEVHSDTSSRKLEYLIVLRVSDKPAAPTLTVRSIAEMQHVGAEFRCGNQTVKVRFRRDGDIGGDITTTTGGKAVQRELVQKVDDNYRHWSKDPRYRKWTSDPAYSFLHISQ